MELETLRMAHNLLRCGEYTCDLILYEKVARMIQGRLGDQYELDQDFISRKNTSFNDQRAHYHQSFIATLDEDEQDRIDFVHYTLNYQCGNLDPILLPYERRITHMGLAKTMTLMALEARQHNYIQNLSTIEISQSDRGDFYKVNCVLSVSFLRQGDFYEASQGFIKVFPYVKDYDYAEVLSSEDVMTYGLLCALATFEPDKLQVEDPCVGVVLDLKNCISHLFDGRFSQIFEMLERSKPILLLDIYLYEHVDILFSRIKDVIIAGPKKTVVLELKESTSNSPLGICVREYANKYKGRNKILRLLHIARQTKLQDMRYEAFRIAHELLRSEEHHTCDVCLYSFTSEKSRAKFGDHYSPDDADFVGQKELNFTERVRQYVEDLRNTQNMFYQCGKRDELKPLPQGRFRSIHLAILTKLMALEARQYSVVRDLSLFEIGMCTQFKSYDFKVKCLLALSYLGEKDYYKAAEKFIKVFQYVNYYDYAEVLSFDDVMTYGLLYALATFKRDKLQEVLLKVEEPCVGVVLDLKNSISHFLNGQFSFSYDLLERLKPRFMLDLYLCEHLDDLFSMIEELIIAGYQVDD